MPDAREQSSMIQQQNDQFRSTVGLPIADPSIQGMAVMTTDVGSLNPEQQAAIFTAVREFDVFNADNDPHNEHDFGIIELADVGKINWKIDYYDLKLEYGSEAAWDLNQTKRVLTIMFAHEY